jgi:AraC-like DNA-binding protein
VKKGYIALSQYTHPARPERIVDLLCQFLHSQEEGFSCPMEADLLVARMLIELAFHRKTEFGDSAVQRLTQQVKKIVDTRYNEKELCPGVVAQALDVNRDYLGRVFKQGARESIGSYIIHRRLREARKLLLESGLNINQVAQAVGFRDPGYFRRLFRKHFDMKPVELRRLYFRTHVNVR